MPRSARLVVPNVPHHVIQRGNRRQAIFQDDADREAYVSMLANALQRHGTSCLAWCLMGNHVHLILVPQSADGLRGPLASAHTNYAQHFNRKTQADGHLFQGRFLSYPMDDAHLMVAARYIENNPVKAGMVARAEDWPWSSVRAHLGIARDRLTDVAPLGQHIANWRAMLAEGLEYADQIESAMKSGRPLGTPEWIAGLALELGHSLDRPKMGRPPTSKK